MNVESDPIEVVKRPLSAIDVEKLSITLNIRRSGLECLTNEKYGTKFRSRDVPASGETDEQVLAPLFLAAKERNCRAVDAGAKSARG